MSKRKKTISSNTLAWISYIWVGLLGIGIIITRIYGWREAATVLGSLALFTALVLIPIVRSWAKRRGIEF